MGWIANVKRIFSDLPNWLLAITFFLPIIGFVLGWIVQVHPMSVNTRFVLSALISGQASILAIVFSVTVIGVQLVATRYSPRMISLFTRAPILVFTFSLFIFSIAVDIGLLYNVPSASHRLHTAGSYSAIGLSLASVIALFVFIQAAIRQSTPEGIIDAFVKDLTPDKYLSQIERMVEDELRNVHPLQPLYSMVMEALSNRRRATAEIALRNYGNHSRGLFEEFQERESFEKEESRVSRDLFKPILEEQLPRIVLHAEEQDESHIVGEATDWIYKLGDAGLELSEPTVSRQAVNGLTDVIIHAPIDSGDYISSDTAWRKLGALLEDAAEYPRPQIVWAASSTIMHRGPQMLWRAHDGRRFQHSMTDLYEKIKMSHRSLLDQFGKQIAEIDIEWRYDSMPVDIKNKKQIECVHRLRKGLFRTTEAFVGYYLEEGDYPITEGNFKGSWQDICVNASNSPARDYAIALCQALIELAFIDVQDGGELNCVYNIAHVKHKGEPDVVDAAFERILSYDQVEEDPGPFIFVIEDEGEDTYYPNILRIRKFLPLNAQPQFVETVKGIQEQANEHWEYLKDS